MTRQFSRHSTDFRVEAKAEMQNFLALQKKTVMERNSLSVQYRLKVLTHQDEAIPRLCRG